MKLLFTFLSQASCLFINLGYKFSCNIIVCFVKKKSADMCGCWVFGLNIGNK